MCLFLRTKNCFKLTIIKFLLFLALKNCFRKISQFFFTFHWVIKHNYKHFCSTRFHSILFLIFNKNFNKYHVISSFIHYLKVPKKKLKCDLCRNWNLHHKNTFLYKTQSMNVNEMSSLKNSVTRKRILIKLAMKFVIFLCKTHKKPIKCRVISMTTTIRMEKCMKLDNNDIFYLWTFTIVWTYHENKGLICFLLILPSILIWHSTSL